MNQSTPTSFRRGRRTLYKGVMMRSRTEARFAAALDQAQIPWDYEPFALASRVGQWLPDFEIQLDPRHRSFVDVKPKDTDVLDKIEQWHTIATEALPGETVRVFGAGYEGATVWTERALRGTPGDIDSWGWHMTGVQIEAIMWDPTIRDTGAPINYLLSRFCVSTHLAIHGLAQ